jgi:23S rRNA pseudouridine955/2504/2580 synthase/23S rRNA pseudouridine1911/1915/1917 synthase
VENRIIIEDEHLVAVRKSAGELVVADRFGLEKNVLLHQLGAYLRARGHKPDETGRDLYPVHRLDRDTSGVVLFAKHHEAHRRLSKMFEGREMKKIYWALACGRPDWDACRCEVPLRRAEGKKGRGRALVDFVKGKEAITEFTLREKLGNVSWIEARPLTGRLHQIRVHLKVLGHPILFDEAYWEKTWKCEILSDIPPQRLPLHARAIRFRHPFTETEIGIDCPMDEDMRSLLQRLQAAAARRVQ